MLARVLVLTQSGLHSAQKRHKMGYGVETKQLVVLGILSNQASRLALQSQVPKADLLVSKTGMHQRLRLAPRQTRHLCPGLPCLKGMRGAQRLFGIPMSQFGWRLGNGFVSLGNEKLRGDHQTLA